MSASPKQTWQEPSLSQKRHLKFPLQPVQRIGSMSSFSRLLLISAAIVSYSLTPLMISSKVESKALPDILNVCIPISVPDNALIVPDALDVFGIIRLIDGRFGLRYAFGTLTTAIDILKPALGGADSAARE